MKEEGTSENLQESPTADRELEPNNRGKNFKKYQSFLKEEAGIIKNLKTSSTNFELILKVEWKYRKFTTTELEGGEDTLRYWSWKRKKKSTTPRNVVLLVFVGDGHCPSSRS